MGMQNAGDGKGLGDSPPPKGVSPPCTCPSDNRGFMGSEMAPCPRAALPLGSGICHPNGATWVLGTPRPPAQPWASPAHQSGVAVMGAGVLPGTWSPWSPGCATSNLLTRLMEMGP